MELRIGAGFTYTLRIHFSAGLQWTAATLHRCPQSLHVSYLLNLRGFLSADLLPVSPSIPGFSNLLNGMPVVSCVQNALHGLRDDALFMSPVLHISNAVQHDRSGALHEMKKCRYLHHEKRRQATWFRLCEGYFAARQGFHPDTLYGRPGDERMCSEVWGLFPVWHIAHYEVIASSDWR